jgi:hypothetical protein
VLLYDPDSVSAGKDKMQAHTGLMDFTTHQVLVRANGHSPLQVSASFSNQIGIICLAKAFRV